MNGSSRGDDGDGTVADTARSVEQDRRGARAFARGDAVIEAYTCYPVAPLGFLLASGIVQSLDEVESLLASREITVTGGMNLARAPWNNPALHAHVLKNPGLQLDEVAAFAKLRTVTPEFLKLIADRREWAQRPEIALALVRNPKTPVNVAIRLLDYVGVAELRQLAKDQHTRTPIQHAARKKVVG